MNVLDRDGSGELQSSVSTTSGSNRLGCQITIGLSDSDQDCVNIRYVSYISTARRYRAEFQPAGIKSSEIARIGVTSSHDQKAESHPVSQY